MTGTLTWAQMCAVGAALGWTVQMMQRFGVEASGAPLKDDGIAGRKTMAGIYISPEDLAHPITIGLAEYAQLGAREEGGNNHGRWPAHFMRDKKIGPMTPRDVAALPAAEIARLAKIEQGPTCAGTIERVLIGVMGAAAPRSLGAREMGRLWASGPGGQVVKLEDAREGDLIVWRRETADGSKTAGHIGGVVGKTQSLILTLEGNGGRDDGAVGLYGYTLADEAARGRAKNQEVIMIARRPR